MNRKLQLFQAKLGRYYIPFVSLMLSIGIILLGYSNVQPRDYNFELNQVAQDTILAPVTMEDTEQTLLNKERARQSVADIYVYNEDVKIEMINLVEQYFGFIRQIRNGSYTKDEIITLVKEHVNADEDYLISDNALAELNRIDRPASQAVSFGQLEEVERMLLYTVSLSNANDTVQYTSDNINANTLDYLLSVGVEELSQVQSTLTEIMSSILEQEILPSNVSSFVTQFERSINEMSLGIDTRRVLKDFVNLLTIPTMVYSESETERRREEAAMEIQPTYILQGQVIIQEGHIIDQNSLRQLELYGFLDGNTPNTIAYAFYGTVLLHLGVILTLFTQRFKFEELDLPKQNMGITAYSIVLLIGFVLLKLFQIIQANGMSFATLAVPVFLIPFMITPKTNPRTGIMAVLFFNLIALFIINDYENLSVITLTTLFYFFSSIMGMFFVLRKESYRYNLKDFFLPVTLWHLAIAASLILSLGINILSEQALTIIAMSFTNMILINGILFFILPYWDQLLIDKAEITLNQLANLNHPLLKLLIEKAPGTYHHSILVANLSANAVEAIGGDSLLTRVAGYYHDIGKTNRPLFFVENISAGMESPHQMMKPEESAQVIIDHSTQGAQILDAYLMPVSIIDICRQHHGTTLVKYFYYQAKKSKQNITEEDFRYLGPKPQSKEAAVVMLADSVEAASRTLKDYTQQSIEALIDIIIEDKVSDNQFSECHLTVHELRIVRRSLISGVAGMYHTRVEYPKG